MSELSYLNMQHRILHEVPYNWYSFPNIISDALKRELSAAYPVDNFVEASRISGSAKNYKFRICKLYSKGEFSDKFNYLSPIWQKFVQELSSEEYFQTLCGSLNVPIENFYVEISLYRYRQGDWVTAHVDNETKVISQLFYLNVDWENYWGGQIYLSASDKLTDIKKVISPHEITSIALIRTPAAWHGVFPVTHSAKSDRLSLQYEIWLK